jgi:hypothetical protein
MMRVWIESEHQWAVDEMCICGHPRSTHGSHTVNTPPMPLVRLNDVGSCCEGRCACRRFRWAAWVFEEVTLLPSQELASG